ncbi:MAG: YkvA family protein [Candidatus Sericytochromatia bacterium]
MHGGSDADTTDNFLLARIGGEVGLPRVLLFLLLAFVASPIDLIPDVIPVIGFADDVVITALVLRWITRTSGPEALSGADPREASPNGLVLQCHRRIRLKKTKDPQAVLDPR